jgi:hypothetical protein
LNELGIPTTPQVFSDSHSLIARNKNRIYHGTAVAHIVTKDYLAADLVRDGEIDLRYIPTAEMLADCFPKWLLKPAFLKQCEEMWNIGNRLGNGLGNGLRNCLGTFGNGLGNRIGIGNENGIGIAVGK